MDDSLDCASSLKQDTFFFKARYLVMYENRVSCNKCFPNTDDLPADDSLDCEEDASSLKQDTWSYVKIGYLAISTSLMKMILLWTTL